MQAEDFPETDIEDFPETDIEISRWLETHHPIEIFDKRMPYPSNFYLGNGIKKYGTLREVINSLGGREFSYSKVMQKYVNLLATNQPVSVEPIRFFIKCLKEKRIVHKTSKGEEHSVSRDETLDAANADDMIQILSNCKEPGINQVMSDYIDFIQTQFIELMMLWKDNYHAKYERKTVLEFDFKYLIIPFLQVLTNLNRNPKGNDLIISNLANKSSSGSDYYYPTLVNFLWEDGNYNGIRKKLMDKHRAPAEAAQAGIDEILARVDRDANARAVKRVKEAGPDASLFRPKVIDRAEEKKQFAEQFTRRAKKTLDNIVRNNTGGGKRTKKRKQKRSTNKKRRVHKKRGRISKRR
jgi:hypothetical protein